MKYNSSLKNIYHNSNKFIFLSFITSLIIYAFWVFNKGINNDFYFLYKTGENIIQNGFPVTDTFTMHSGLDITVQQWLSSVVFYFVYKITGEFGLMLFIFILCAVINILTYKILTGISDGNYVAAFLPACVAVLLNPVSFTTRPSVFTFLFCLIETDLLFQYSSTGKKKLLIFLPVLSILQINFHSSMWIFLLIIVLPFLFESIKIKKLQMKRFEYSDYPAIPLFVAFFSMVAVAFINPYTYKNVFYLFNSMNKYSNAISEMQHTSLDSSTGILTFSIILGVIFILFQTKHEFSIITVCYFLGGILLILYAVRCFPYFACFSMMVVAEALKNINLEAYIEKLKIYKIVLCEILVLFACITFISIRIPENFFEMHKAVDFLAENYSVNDKKTYTSFNDGAYAEFKGIKPYIDPRMEVFLKVQNGKDDIWYEYIEIQEEHANITKFIDKYQFDYMILDSDDTIRFEYNNHPETFSDYKAIYNEEDYIILAKR